MGRFEVVQSMQRGGDECMEDEKRYWSSSERDRFILFSVQRLLNTDLTTLPLDLQKDTECDQRMLILIDCRDTTMMHE